jgi:hypothetical protein
MLCPSEAEERDPALKAEEKDTRRVDAMSHCLSNHVAPFLIKVSATAWSRREVGVGRRWQVASPLVYKWGRGLGVQPAVSAAVVLLFLALAVG